ncbi:MAG: multiheme c-type cytochrome [Ignavibacteria bacterium]
MKYFSYFIFIAFIVTLLLFLRNALKPETEQVYITGSEKCGECHSLQNIGNQSDIWIKSRHSIAYKTLLGDKATDFAAKNNLVKPAENPECLKCHSTEYSLGNPLKSEAPRYSIEEGVGCESCHGAGSLYSPAEIMKDEGFFKSNGGIKGDESTCKNCHSPKGNKEHRISVDMCPFQENEFDYRTAFEKIKHPLNKDFKSDK